jgi:molybdopterin/thiamine biosynthesis adenylyltransferase
MPPGKCVQKHPLFKGNIMSEDFQKILSEIGLNSQDAYHKVAFARNDGLLTKEEQARLKEAKIAIPGMGGVGGLHLITAIRTGVGRFHLADFDLFDPINVNRQFGAKVPNFGKPKLETMICEALSINPFLDITPFPEGITADNLDAFLEGADVVLDGLDFFEFDLRRTLFNRAREKGIYVVTAAPLGFSCALLIFAPDTGMSFDEYFDIYDCMPQSENYLRFALGLAPRPTHIKYMNLKKVDLKKASGPSLGIATQICSGMGVTEAIRIILNRPGLKPVPHYVQFDPYVKKFKKGYLRKGNANLFQKGKIFFIKNFILKDKFDISLSPPHKPKFDPDPPTIPKNVIYYLIQAGIRAPSGDNAQPWYFSWQNNEISLFLNPDADHSFFNVDQYASIISCGAVIENIRIAAQSLGFDTIIDHLPEPENNYMARIKLTSGSQKQVNSNDKAVWLRCTNRTRYSPQKVSEKILEEIKKEIDAFAGVNIHFVTQKSDLKKLARTIYKADRIRTEHKGLHLHFMHMLRIKEKDIFSKCDGLPIKNLEAGPGGEIFLRLTKPWFVMQCMNYTGIGRLVALHSYCSILNSAGVALITVNTVNKKNFLIGGQALERAWISFQNQGISIQPMTAITLFHLRWLLHGKEEFTPRHQKLLTTAWKSWDKIFPDIDSGKHGQVMLFRFGYGQKISFPTPRKKIEDFLLK